MEPLIKFNLVPCSYFICIFIVTLYVNVLIYVSMSVKISVLFNKKSDFTICTPDLISDLIKYNFQPYKCPSVHLH